MTPKPATKKTAPMDPTLGLCSTKEKLVELARSHEANSTVGDSACMLSMSKELLPSDLLFSIGNLNKNLGAKFLKSINPNESAPVKCHGDQRASPDT